MSENKHTTLGQMRDFAERQDARDDAQDVEIQEHGEKLDVTNVGYGTCATAAATAAKVITVSGNANWMLKPGSIIVVKFSYTNTASNPTFNVNGTGAKSVWYSTALITTGSLSYAGYANRPSMYMYDGTQYIFLGWAYDANTTYTNVKLGQGYATCSTAAATAAKVATLSSYTLTAGGIVAVKFTYDVPASATLNINSKGAKAIYHRGAKITAGVIKAGDTATLMYNGSYYHLLSIDRDDNTVYTHPAYTALTGVPAADATPGFGGTFQVTQIVTDATGHVTAVNTRTITIPSTLSNGTGTAGLIKTSSTVTSNSGYTACPVIGGVPYYKDTNTTYSNMTAATSSAAGKAGLVPAPAAGKQASFLRGDGTWVVPTDTKNTAGSTNSSSKLFLIGATSQAANPQTHSHDTAYVGTDGCLYSNNTKVSVEGHTHSYLPLSGGTLTGGLYTDHSIYMAGGIFINSYNPDGTVCAMIYVGANSGDLCLGNENYPHSGDTVVNSFAGDVYIRNSSGNKLVYRAYASTSVGSSSIFNPATDGECMLGGSGTRWARVYAALGEVQTSDEREKSDITAIADYPVMYSTEGEGNIWDKLFSKLVPKTYTMNIEDSGDVHIGFIAQDVEAAMTELGLTVDDVGFVIHDYWTDEETGEERDAYGLAYDEFIALNTYMIQKQQAKINSLEERIAKLEALLEGTSEGTEVI